MEVKKKQINLKRQYICYFNFRRLQFQSKTYIHLFVRKTNTRFAPKPAELMAQQQPFADITQQLAGNENGCNENCGENEQQRDEAEEMQVDMPSLNQETGKEELSPPDSNLLDLAHLQVVQTLGEGLFFLFLDFSPF
jgi:hypothetical protein